MIPFFQVSGDVSLLIGFPIKLSTSETIIVRVIVVFISISFFCVTNQNQLEERGGSSPILKGTGNP